jgi:hypothetical protein
MTRSQIATYEDFQHEKRSSWDSSCARIWRALSRTLATTQDLVTEGMIAALLTYIFNAYPQGIRISKMLDPLAQCLIEGASPPSPWLKPEIFMTIDYGEKNFSRYFPCNACQRARTAPGVRFGNCGNISSHSMLILHL